MRVMDIVVPQKAFQASFKVFGTAKTASGQKTPVQYTKEQLGLIEPRAMDRGKMAGSLPSFGPSLSLSTIG
jgi:hypothetical protein